MSKFRLLIAAVLVAVAASGLARAQSRPSATVTTATTTNITAAVSTNAPTLCTGSYSNGTFRLYLSVQNTNAAGDVVVYRGTTAAAPVRVLTPGQVFERQFPLIDNSDYSVRATSSNALPVLVHDAWGN
jgi:hypothetical protein